MNQPQPQAYQWTIDRLLADLEAFLKANPHISEEQVGWFSIRQPNLLKRLRGGGDITTRKLDLVLAWLRSPVLTLKKEASDGTSEEA